MKATGVGSRKAPDEIAQLFTAFVYYTMTQGLEWASGSSGIMDEAVEQGALMFFDQVLKPEGKVLGDLDKHFRSYLPWPRFGDRPTCLDDNGNARLYYVASKLANFSIAEDVASKLHPVWGRLTQGAQKLHSRNVYQVLDVGLDRPSELIVYWAKPTSSGQVSGGTNMAVQIARQHKVLELNAFHSNVSDFMTRYVDERLELTDLMAFAESIKPTEATA